MSVSREINVTARYEISREINLTARYEILTDVQLKSRAFCNVKTRWRVGISDVSKMVLPSSSGSGKLELPNGFISD
jgi:hypothetical protein